MPRGRKPLQTTPPVEPDLNADRIAYAAEIMVKASIKSDEELAAVKKGLSDDRDLVNQLLGQAQMAEAFSKFSLTVSTSKLAFVKENKLYQSLAGKKTADGQHFSGTWDEFCSMLGRSRQQIDEDIANLKALGEEALDSMSRMGIGYREMRQYRRLPEDQKTALLEAAKSGDKDSFLELAEDLIAKHAREKEEAQRQIEELKAEDKAKLALLAAKGSTIDALNTKLLRRDNAPADERLDHLRKEITSIADDARGAIIGHLRQRLHELAEHHNQAGGDSLLWAAGILGQLSKDIVTLRDEMGIPDLAGCEVPEWLEEPLTAPAAEPPGHDGPEPGKPH